MEKINFTKSLVLGLMISLATVANAAKKESQPVFNHFGNHAQQEWFHTTKINAPVKVVFERSHRFSVAVVSDDIEVAKGIKYDINKGVLNIKMDKGMDSNSVSENNVTVIISAPMLPKMTTNKNYTTVE